MDSDQAKYSIIDLDGTLVRLQVNWDQVRDLVAEYLRRHNLQYDKALRLDGNIFRVKARSQTDFLELAQKVADAEGAELTVAHVNLELIEKLRAGGRPWAIFTANSHRTATQLLARREFRMIHPQMIIGREDVDYPKPHPFGAEKILQSLNWDPSEVEFVGDSSNDEEAARGAGVQFSMVNPF